MNRGIYLGPPIGWVRRLAWLLVAMGSVATSFHALRYLAELEEVRAARESVARRESSRAVASSDALGVEGEATLARLRATSLSGVLDSASITEVLRIVGSALPDRMTLLGLTYEPVASPPSLLIEATAQREDDVTALQKRITGSSRVAATKLLGERRAPDGSLAVRLQVELTSDGEP